jgi:hypothetical protein
VTKKADALEAAFTVAAVWLALRGDNADAIASRAQAAAQAAETMRKRLELFVMGRVRDSMGCQKPHPCACLVCAAYEADAAKPTTRPPPPDRKNFS